jgi:hypothetical protein
MLVAYLIFKRREGESDDWSTSANGHEVNSKRKAGLWTSASNLLRKQGSIKVIHYPENQTYKSSNLCCFAQSKDPIGSTESIFECTNLLAASGQCCLPSKAAFLAQLGKCKEFGLTPLVIDQVAEHLRPVRSQV